MKKVDFVSQVAEKTGVSKKQAGAVIDAALKVITEILEEEDSINFVGFGTFLVKERAAREGHNPATGEKIKIEASKQPAFKPSKVLKDIVNGK